MTDDSSVKAGGCPADGEFVYSKSYTCPLCGSEVKSTVVRSTKVRMIGSDFDLRPIYENFDVLKYDIILCNCCGYGALERYFSTLTQVQKKLITAKVSPAYKPKKWGATYTYKDAFIRYRIALANSIAKQGPDSEKAYVALRAAWLLRGWRESLDESDPLRSKLESQEKELLQHAKESFQQANMKEDYPICGMDEATMDYLMAALSVHCGEYDAAIKLLSNVIASRQTNARIKDRARDLKDDIAKKTKGQG